MKLPLLVMLKDIFGIYVITPFEQDLFNHLKLALNKTEQETLDYQLTNFTTTSRFLKAIDEPFMYGYTEFHTSRLGKSITDKRQKKRFNSNKEVEMLAKIHIILDGDSGEINAKFELFNGVLLIIRYGSPQKIYYPPASYKIDWVELWPDRNIIPPFEQDLLDHLKLAMNHDDREILEHQLAHFTKVRRLTREFDAPLMLKCIEFHTSRLGRGIANPNKQKIKRFNGDKETKILAKARIVFDGEFDEINVKFGLAKGILFDISYRFRKKTNFPIDSYQIKSIEVWPDLKTPIND